MHTNEERVSVSIRVNSRLRNLSLAAPPQTRATKKGSPRISNRESTLLMHTNEDNLFVSIRVHSRLLNLSLAGPLQTRASNKCNPRISNHESTLMQTNEANLC